MKEEYLQWKLTKNKLDQELQAKTKQLERWSHVNVDKLILENQKKEKELQSLKVSESATQKKLDMIEERRQKEIRELQRQLAEEKKLKATLLQKVESLQTESEVFKKVLTEDQVAELKMAWPAPSSMVTRSFIELHGSFLVAFFKPNSKNKKTRMQFLTFVGNRDNYFFIITKSSEE